MAKLGIMAANSSYKAMYDIVEQAKKERLLLYTLYKHVSILPIFYLPSGYW